MKNPEKIGIYQCEISRNLIKDRSGLVMKLELRRYGDDWYVMDDSIVRVKVEYTSYYPSELLMS